MRLGARRRSLDLVEMTDISLAEWKRARSTTRPRSSRARSPQIYISWLTAEPETICAFFAESLRLALWLMTNAYSYKKGQLLPENLQEAVKAAGLSDDQVKITLREGYDHSYYFIQSFGPDHIAFHAKYLKA